MTATLTQIKGLCTTCESVTSCKYLSFQDQPVIFCEEFDDHKRNGHIENVDLKAILAYMKVKPQESKVQKGLCINCETRETCQYPRTEGGVWHCEEYR